MKKESDWKTFYQETESPEPYCLIEPQKNQYEVKTTSAYILSCTFQDINSSIGGGAIQFSTNNRNEQILVEKSVFDNCHTNDERGGAIYVGYSSGSCVTHQCCASQCWSKFTGTSRGQFIYTSLSDNNNHINQVKDCSIIRSSPPENSDSRGSLYLYQSIITVNIVNLSDNSCFQYPSAFLCPSFTSQLNECYVSFSSIQNNTGTRCIGLLGKSSSCDNLMQCSNLIGNQVSDFGLIWTESQVTIEGCAFLENEAATIFYRNSGSFIIINCTIPYDYLTKTAPDSKSFSFSQCPPSILFKNNIDINYLTELCPTQTNERYIFIDQTIFRSEKKRLSIQHLFLIMVLH